MITDNIATVLTNLFIGHYGRTAHKPRWMAIGCVVTGLSVMITALPYFIYGAAKETDLELVGNMTGSLISKSRAGDQMCYTNIQKEDCSDMITAKTMTIVAVACFGISNFFRGFGTSIYFTYGTPYLDDNVSKAKMPTFFAFIFAARIFGAPIGFILASSVLKLYENPFAVPKGLTVTDPRWIGAWWIGFLVSGSLMLLLAIPLSLFPREFKKSAKQSRRDVQLANLNQQNKSSANGQSGEPMLEIDLNQDNGATSGGLQQQQEGQSEGKKLEDISLRELPEGVLKIISNPLIICQMMGNMFRGLGLLGYFVFQTRYLEAQFRQSASKASLVSGTTGFLAKIVGVLAGGMLITLCRPGPRVLTTYIFIVELTSVFTLMYGASVLGPQYLYPQTSITPDHHLQLANHCNSKCHCDFVRYQPVCEHREMKAYFSPCHAGCKMSFLTVDNSTAYSQCSCVDNADMTLEKCPSDSDNLMRYASIVALGGMISGSSRSGNMVTFLRSTSPDQKSMLVSVGSFWHSLFVSIPYPIIYGKIFDFCCLVWSVECGKRGNCWLYDTEKLRIIYHTVSIALIAMGSVFDLIMIYLSPRLGNLYDENDKPAVVDRILNYIRSKRKTNKADKRHTTPTALEVNTMDRIESS